MICSAVATAKSQAGRANTASPTSGAISRPTAKQTDEPGSHRSRIGSRGVVFQKSWLPARASAMIVNTLQPSTTTQIQFDAARRARREQHAYLAEEAGKGRQSRDPGRADDEQHAEERWLREFRPRQEGVVPIAALLGDQLGEQEQAGNDEGAVDEIVDPCRDAAGARHAYRDHQRSHRGHGEVGHQAAQAAGGERADRGEGQGDEGGGQQHVGPQRRRRTGDAEGEDMDAQHGVHPDLGHDREQRGHRGGGGGIGSGQPEVERESSGLQAEDDEQQHRRRFREPPVGGRHLCEAHLQVREIEGSGHAVEEAERDEEQRRAGEVEHDVVDAGPQAPGAAAVKQQAVGGDEQYLEEHEEIE